MKKYTIKNQFVKLLIKIIYFMYRRSQEQILPQGVVMPLVDFTCCKCSTTKEKLVKDVTELQVCDCGYIMTRQVGKTNFELKGKGWFKDGYSK